MAAVAAVRQTRVAVDFHFNVEHPVMHACKVVRKALGQRLTVLVHSSDAQRLSRLDAALWTFSALDFLPHVYADSELAPRTPVWLSLDTVSSAGRDVLVLMSDEPVPDFERWFTGFSKVIEIVSTDDEDRARARNRFKAYRARGFEPSAHDLAVA
jgi:DNA polymerase III subunit chi